MDSMTMDLRRDAFKYVPKLSHYFSSGKGSFREIKNKLCMA